MGILYFETLIPIQNLFSRKNNLEQLEWLELWKNIITSEYRTSTLCSIKNSEKAKTLLEAHNIGIVAERIIENQVFNH